MHIGLVTAAVLVAAYVLLTAPARRRADAEARQRAARQRTHELATSAIDAARSVCLVAEDDDARVVSRRTYRYDLVAMKGEFLAEFDILAARERFDLVRLVDGAWLWKLTGAEERRDGGAGKVLTPAEWEREQLDAPDDDDDADRLASELERLRYRDWHPMDDRHAGACEHAYHGLLAALDAAPGLTPDMDASAYVEGAYVRGAAGSWTAPVHAPASAVGRAAQRYEALQERVRAAACARRRPARHGA